jgi:hypothetical protein
VLVRSGVEEKTGELLPPAVVAQRVAWCSDLVAQMVTAVLADRWNAPDVVQLASGLDAGGQPLPSNAWMALRRLGWTAKPAQGIKVNDRVVRMAQEQAGRTLRSAGWRAEVVAGILKTWPVDPERRTPAEWDAVRDAIEGGRELPGSVIKGRTRQIARFLKAAGRLPGDVFALEGAPRVSPMLLLAACDAQQASLTRDEVHPRAALLRLQPPRSPRLFGLVLGRDTHPRARDGPRPGRPAPAHAAPYRRQGVRGRGVQPRRPEARAHRSHGRARRRLGPEHPPVGRRGLASTATGGSAGSAPADSSGPRACSPNSTGCGACRRNSRRRPTTAGASPTAGPAGRRPRTRRWRPATPGWCRSRRGSAHAGRT